MVEIGCPGDLSVKGLAGRKNVSERDYLASQKHLEKHSSVIMPLELQADPEMEWRHRIIVPEKRSLCGDHVQCIQERPLGSCKGPGLA